MMMIMKENLQQSDIIEERNIEETDGMVYAKEL